MYDLLRVGLRVQDCLWFRFSGSGFRVTVLGCRSRVKGLGFRVEGFLGLKV